jgi:hypothetical protein
MALTDYLTLAEEQLEASLAQVRPECHPEGNYKLYDIWTTHAAHWAQIVATIRASNPVVPLNPGATTAPAQPAPRRRRRELQLDDTP